MPPPLPHITLEMSISANEFCRLLNNLPGESESLHQEVMPDMATWWLESPAGNVRITFRSMPPLRRGALTLPRAYVELDMAALPAQARATFLARFRRHFQRGGG